MKKISFEFWSKLYFHFIFYFVFLWACFFIEQCNGETSCYFLRPSGWYLAHIWATLSIHSGRSIVIIKYESIKKDHDININNVLGDLVHYNWIVLWRRWRKRNKSSWLQENCGGSSKSAEWTSIFSLNTWKVSSISNI